MTLTEELPASLCVTTFLPRGGRHGSRSGYYAEDVKSALKGRV